eukprot:jgi/Chlat1/3420/Chrsp23S03749
MDPTYANGTSGMEGPKLVDQVRHTLQRRSQFYLDKATPFPTYRWLGTLGLLGLYALRVCFLQGFYIVTYGLGIYVLNLFIGFLSPQIDPESDGPQLPTKGSDEFKPFVRRLPEFKFWYNVSKGVVVAFFMTFFPVFDVPVFWPILLVYWIMLFFLTMKRQILHMIKYRYLPFSRGKQVYKNKGKEKVTAPTADAAMAAGPSHSK